MDIAFWVWPSMAAIVVGLLALDLAFFGRRGQEISLRRAIGWSAGWTALGVAVTPLLWGWQGRKAAEEYFAGFVIEKSLSIDNLFVFALIFSYFSVPAAHQRRVLFWGIVGAIVLRGIFILGGGAQPGSEAARARLPHHHAPRRRSPRHP